MKKVFSAFCAFMMFLMFSITAFAGAPVLFEETEGIINTGGEGLGLMIGIKTVKDAKEIANECLKRGVLVLTAKDKVRLLPPLNIDTELLKKALEVIKEVCKL